MEKCTVNIRQLREDAGMTQEELAKKMGVKPPAVSKWERGLAFPTMDKVGRLAKLFGCTMEHVMGIDTESA
ncbi:helix-turn-helix domain-containing protein [Dysosmobacter sp.]